MASGFGGLCDPLFLLIFVSPWFVETFLIGFPNFIFIWDQYFGYTLAGALAATILAMRNMKNPRILRYASLSMIVFAVIFFLSFPHFMYSKNVNNLQQDYLFKMSPGEMQQIQQLNSMIALIPKNASVMGPYFAMSQLFGRQYFEMIPSEADNYTIQPTNTSFEGSTMWFEPEYIVADFNPYISLNAGSGSQIQNFVNITGATISGNTASFNGLYQIYAQNGTAILLKRR